MPGLVPGIDVFLWFKNVDGRDKPGHDGVRRTFRSHRRCTQAARLMKGAARLPKILAMTEP
jgi:hypothetical protein